MTEQITNGQPVTVSPLEPLQVDLAEAARLLRYSRATIYEMLNSGELPSTRRGAKCRISMAAAEIWTFGHGQLLQVSSLEVRVLRRPLSAVERTQPAPKSDLDSFLPQHGPNRLQQLIDDAPLLEEYAASLPHAIRGWTQQKCGGGLAIKNALDHWRSSAFGILVGCPTGFCLATCTSKIPLWNAFSQMLLPTSFL